MKVALLLSLLLLAATTVLAQDSTSQFVSCTASPSGAPGNNITCVVISQVNGALDTNGAFVVTTTSPTANPPSGGILYAPNPLTLQGSNTSVFSFLYTIGNAENRLLNFSVTAGGNAISGSPISVTVGNAIVLNTFTQTIDGNTVTTANIYQSVAYTAGYSNRAISWVINYGDGTSDSFAPPPSTPIVTNHKFFPGNSARQFTISGVLFDGVTTQTSSNLVITVNPCAIGTNSNQNNDSCVPCLNSCNDNAVQRCQAVTGQPPSCQCAVGVAGPDCAITNAQYNSGVPTTGTVNVTGKVNGAGVSFYLDNGSRKRSVPSGTSFVFGSYTIPNGETFPVKTTLPTPAIAFGASLVNSNNLPIPPGTIMQITIDISGLQLLSSTSAGNTIQLLYRSSPNNWIDPTNSCSAVACNNIGLPGCKSVTDFTAVFAICQPGGTFAVFQNVALIGAPTTPSFATGGSLTSTIPPVPPAIANQQLPNGKPSSVSPVPVPTPVVLPPNSPFSPPTQSGAGALQPITLVIFAVVTLVLVL